MENASYISVNEKTRLLVIDQSFLRCDDSFDPEWDRNSAGRYLTIGQSVRTVSPKGFAGYFRVYRLCIRNKASTFLFSVIISLDAVDHPSYSLQLGRLIALNTHIIYAVEGEDRTLRLIGFPAYKC